MAYRRKSEVRWHGKRFRIFTVVSNDEADTTRSVRIGNGEVEYEARGLKGVDAFIAAFSLNQITTCVGAESWSHGITLEKAQQKLTAWRKRCEAAGFKKVGSFME